MTKEALLKKIGERVAAEREKQGITQAELARLTGKDRQGIFKIENGDWNVSVFHLLQIAEALKIKLSNLTDID